MTVSHGRSAAARIIHAPVSRSFSGPFGRLFRNLPAWEPSGDNEAAQIEDIARIALEMVDDGTDRDNHEIPSGYTYLGQFVDHDLTFDPRSSLQKAMDPESLEDFRTPSFDLDCLYGRGPADQPYLYEADEKHFLIARNEAATDDDLPRNIRGKALIGDKRNDENTFVSQLQLVFLKFHNAVLDQEANGNFEEAHRIVRWHYQWVVVHDWLKKLCGEQRIDDMLNVASGASDRGKPKLQHYGYKDYAFMPVEFSVAAYRLGHSMIRGGYRITPDVAFPTFSMTAVNDPPGDFRGFRSLPSLWTIQWSRFFDFTGEPGVDLSFQPSRNLDRFLVGPVITMPDQVAAPVSPAPASVARSLAFRNLLRSWRLGLPSGQAVARLLCADIPQVLSEGPELPLWRYILDEADIQQQGKKLGQVGSTIVAETFIGLLAADPSSFYRMNPCWTPTLPKIGANFEIRDIIKFSGARIV